MGPGAWLKWKNTCLASTGPSPEKKKRRITKNGFVIEIKLISYSVKVNKY
jgi:hypothetical protein